ncbi:questin oxidase family protein [Tsukamurella sp. 1534]|uniref:questin oxidase family protein n=1 Tax=Tsukamurella sp. 1534 TaxID=1151061 RepID=UPI00031B4ADC|nr:questin oxidase family protein [Tsukamurella sp. 1534]
MTAQDELDEAYQRLQRTGPEFQGFLSNHGPMVVEALVRRGREGEVSRWLDGYVPKLDGAPHVARPARWPDDLGDPAALGAWIATFTVALQAGPWKDVLAEWWPRLLPGVAAGATHGAIRVGHAVDALLTWGETPERSGELAQALGYWAARWRPVPRTATPAGDLSAPDALAAVPRVPHPDGGIGERLRQLDDLGGWPSAQRALAPGDAEEQLRGVVTAAVLRYATHAHGSPVMLVHAATAPNALRRALRALPERLHAATAAAGWSAAAAIFAAYGPDEARGLHAGDGAGTADDIIDRATHHGDEHVIKLTDTALDVLTWTGDVRAAQAASVASRAIPRG